MKTFVIFDRKSGEILQTHVQMGDMPTSPEEILKMARPEAEGATVEVMEVEGLAPGTSYRVDIKGKKLLTVEGSKARGAGGAFVQQVGSGDPLMARTVVVPLRQKKK